MRFLFFVLLISFVPFFSNGDEPSFSKEIPSNLSHPNEHFGNLLNCPAIDMSGSLHAGQSLLQFIVDTVKPDLDRIALEGYPVADGETLVSGLDKVDGKVRRKALREVRGKSHEEKLENLRKLGDSLQGPVNLKNSVSKMSATGLVNSGPYNLSTYIGLASCGGTTLKLADDNYAYNIHYATGKDLETGEYVYDDKKSGRSFGASRIFRAIDSSYSHYFKELESYITKSQLEAPEFIRTIMESVSNTDLSGYDSINNYGDAVLTDFLAIWTAEQTRNLMDGHITLHWDAALFEVTLLSASFHAGQNQIHMYYGDPVTGKKHFTSTTKDLTWPKKIFNKETNEEECVADFDNQTKKQARLSDYIGIHYRTPKNCGRSGVDTSEFKWTRKKLGNEITLFLENDPIGKVLLEKVRSHFSGIVNLKYNEYNRSYRTYQRNIYRELSRFIINSRAPKNMSQWKEFSNDVTGMMSFIKDKANEITETLKNNPEYPSLSL